MSGGRSIAQQTNDEERRNHSGLDVMPRRNLRHGGCGNQRAKRHFYNVSNQAAWPIRVSAPCYLSKSILRVSLTSSHLGLLPKFQIECLSQAFTPSAIVVLPPRSWILIIGRYYTRHASFDAYFSGLGERVLSEVPRKTEDFQSIHLHPLQKLT